jgi:hypothetical protein
MFFIYLTNDSLSKLDGWPLVVVAAREEGI